jgi:hypothetical protein
VWLIDRRMNFVCFRLLNIHKERCDYKAQTKGGIRTVRVDPMDWNEHMCSLIGMFAHCFVYQGKPLSTRIERIPTFSALNRTAGMFFRSLERSGEACQKSRLSDQGALAPS